MNDLVRPTSLYGGARVPAIGPSGVLGTVPNPPPQVSQLSTGTTLTGVVVGHDAEGRTLVRTDQGTLSVATKAQLPVNSEVTLQIRSSGSQLHVLIMHSELQHGGAKAAAAPRTLQPPSAQVGGAQVGGSQAGGSGSQGQTATVPGTGQAAPAGHGPASDLLTLGQYLRAVVQSPALTPNAATGGGVGAGGGTGQPPASLTLSALATQLAPGSELQLRIISVQAPGTQAPGTQVPGTQAAGSPAPGGPASGVPTPGAQSPAAPAITAPSAPGNAPGGVPGGPPMAGQRTASGSLPGAAGAARAGLPPIAGATPNGPNPAAAAPQTPPAAAPTTASGQGAAPGAPGSSGQQTGAQLASAPPSGNATAASAVPPSGAIASYVAVGGPQGSGLIAAASPAALLAAHGLGPSDPGAAAQVGTASTNIADQPGRSPGGSVGSGHGPAGGTSASAAPTIPGAVPAAAAPAGTIQFTGTVTTVTHAGQPVLQTPLGTLTLEIRTPLQIGSRITFELPSGALTTSGPGATGPGPAALGTLAHSWPALDETLRVLQQAAPPGVAAAALQEAIPQPGPRLASGLLFFLSALSNGDVTRWLGHQASQVLKSAGRESLLSRLAQDFGQLGRLADSQGGDWRLFFIPIYDGDQLQQMRLFLRHGWQDQDGGGAQDDEDQTRFVIEVEMSHLGDLQLDGLVRDKRLDLILRSRAPLPDFMRRDIIQIFHETNEITGNRGNISFQSSHEWKAMPIEAPEAAADAGVVV